MTDEDKKLYTKKTLEALITDAKIVWAKNYIAMRVNEKFDTPTGKKEVEACKLNMGIAEQQITNFEFILKNE